MSDLPAATEDAALTLGRSAQLLEGYRFVERRLFELTGEWAVELEVPELQVHLDAVSSQHAWHEELWAQRLPVADGGAPAGTDSGRLSAAVDEVLVELGAEPGDPLTRLAGLYRVVVPRLVTGYARHLRQASEVSDAPVRRALRLVLRDEIESWQEGEELVQGLLQSAEEVAVAGAVRQRLEIPFVTARTGPGLVPWPA